MDQLISRNKIYQLEVFAYIVIYFIRTKHKEYVVYKQLSNKNLNIVSNSIQIVSISVGDYHTAILSSIIEIKKKEKERFL